MGQKKTKKNWDTDISVTNMKDDSKIYVKKEDNKGEVADGKESDLYVVKDKMEKDLNNEREDKISIKNLDKNIEENRPIECDDMQNKKKTKVDTIKMSVLHLKI